MCSERQWHTGIVQPGRIGRGQFPVLQFVEANHAGKVWVRHVIARGEIDGDGHAVACLGDGLGALVTVSAAEHDGVLHAKLREQHVGAQHVFPAARRKNPGQIAGANEGVQGQIGPSGHAPRRRLGVPFGVEMGLAQQRGGSHERVGIVLG